MGTPVVPELNGRQHVSEERIGGGEAAGAAQARNLSRHKALWPVGEEREGDTTTCTPDVPFAAADAQGVSE